MGEQRRIDWARCEQLALLEKAVLPAVQIAEGGRSIRIMPVILKGALRALDGFGRGRECWPSLATLGRSAGMSEKHTRRALKALAQIGLVIVERRQPLQEKASQDGGAAAPAPDRRTLNHYRIVWSELAILCPGSRHQRGAGEAPPGPPPPVRPAALPEEQHGEQATSACHAAATSAAADQATSACAEPALDRSFRLTRVQATGPPVAAALGPAGGWSRFDQPATPEDQPATPADQSATGGRQKRLGSARGSASPPTPQADSAVEGGPGDWRAAAAEILRLGIAIGERIVDRWRGEGRTPAELLAAIREGQAVLRLPQNAGRVARPQGALAYRLLHGAWPVEGLATLAQAAACEGYRDGRRQEREQSRVFWQIINAGRRAGLDEEQIRQQLCARLPAEYVRREGW